MTALLVIYFLTGGIIFFIAALFGVSSLFEQKFRAALISSIITLLIAFYWFAGFFYLEYSTVIQAFSLAVIFCFGLFFFLPVGSGKVSELGVPTEQVDERDTMFAREEYEPGTDKYEQYYSRHPEYKGADDRIRSLPKLLAPGGRHYSQYRSGLIKAIFGKIAALTVEVDGPVNKEKSNNDPSEMSRIIKDTVRNLGAEEVGIAELDPMYVYSHVGRGPEKWGSPIKNNHKYAVVFTLEMDYGRVEDAPRIGITEEAARQYLNAALISTSLAAAVRGLGYPARAHISDSNYQVMLPPIASDAGLGELGRFGYLISRKFGARIRLGGITTDLPLIPDEPIHIGVQSFCEICRKCAINCPSGAIPDGDRVHVRGINKWPLDIEKCITYWRLIGTDCGLCMKVCPFSHPPTLIHNLVRTGIKHSSFAQYISVYGDDLFYGRKLREWTGVQT